MVQWINSLQIAYVVSIVKKNLAQNRIQPTVSTFIWSHHIGRFISTIL